jgi:hypothetical protein
LVWWCSSLLDEVLSFGYFGDMYRTKSSYFYHGMFWYALFGLTRSMQKPRKCTNDAIPMKLTSSYAEGNRFLYQAYTATKTREKGFGFQYGLLG